ncbi:MAG TPA: response regulator [Chryseosolibacter sp.]
MPNEPIVIIDDDTDDHYIFDEVCRRMNLGNELKFFTSALQALEYLRSTNDQPFIIFCDVNMPKMTGLELRRAIDQDEGLRRKSIPFVFFTTAASKPQVVEAYNLTVQGFFIKESTFDETEKVLRLIFEYWKKCRHPNAYQ